MSSGESVPLLEKSCFLRKNFSDSGVDRRSLTVLKYSWILQGVAWGSHFESRANHAESSIVCCVDMSIGPLAVERCSYCITAERMIKLHRTPASLLTPICCWLSVQLSTES